MEQKVCRKVRSTGCNRVRPAIVVFDSAINERCAKLVSERVVVGTMRNLALSIQPSVIGLTNASDA